MKWFSISILFFTIFGCSTPKYIYQDINNVELTSAKNELLGFTKERQANEISLDEAKRKIEEIYLTLLPSAKKICLSLSESQNCNYWRIEILDHDEENAYLSGEGSNQTISFTRKMVSISQNDDEIALIMAHEMSHAILNHLQEDRMNALGGQLLGTMAGAAIGYGIGMETGDPNWVDIFGNTGAEVGNYIGRINFSPSQELEADRIGLEVFLNSGYDFEKGKNILLYLSDGYSFETPYGSTHPVGPERIAHFNRAYEDYENRNFGGAYKELKLEDIKKNQKMFTRQGGDLRRTSFYKKPDKIETTKKEKCIKRKNGDLKISNCKK